MRITNARLLVASALLALAYGQPVWADDTSLPERPRLENYRDYNQFLLDMAAYKKRLREAGSNQGETPAHPREAAPAPVSKVAPAAHAPVVTNAAIPQTTVPTQPVAAVDPANEASPPPLIVNGPEDLDYAVEKARNFPHPVYKVTRRYNRSTAQSFPLPQLEPEELEGNAVSGMWVSKNSLPDDKADMSQDKLDQQADTNETTKAAHKRRSATQKTQEDEDQAANDYQVTLLQGSQPQPQEDDTAYIHTMTSQYGNAAIIDLTAMPADVKTTIHP